MKKGIAAVSVLALVALVGCSTKPTDNLMATTASLISAPPFFPGQIDVVSKSGYNKLREGDFYDQVGTVQLRSCNPGKIQCKLGAAKLKSRVTLVALNKANATVRVDFQLDIGKTQTVATETSGITVKLPDDVPTLHDSLTTTETVSVDYNRIGRFDLPYGIAFKLCVEAPYAAKSTSMSGCQGQEVALPLQSQ